MTDKLIEILKWISVKFLIVQIKSNENRKPKLGKGFMTATRFNKWNPLSYVVLLLMAIIVFFYYGAKNVWGEIKDNPFKWY